MTDIQLLRKFLIAHFGNVSELVTEELEGKEDELLMLRVEVDEHEATIDLMTMVCFFANYTLVFLTTFLRIGGYVQKPCSSQTNRVCVTDGPNHNQQLSLKLPFNIIFLGETRKAARKGYRHGRRWREE